MSIRRSQSLSTVDSTLRIKELVAENKRLRQRMAKLEVAKISLQNENGSLKKQIDKKASEKFSEIIDQIMKRAGEDSGIGPAESRRRKGHTS